MCVGQIQRHNASYGSIRLFALEERDKKVMKLSVAAHSSLELVVASLDNHGGKRIIIDKPRAEAWNGRSPKMVEMLAKTNRFLSVRGEGMTA